MEHFVVTVLPDVLQSFVTTGIVGKAVASGLTKIVTVNPREFAAPPHRVVDDTPYGGGGGMVLKPEPMVAAIEHAETLAKTKPYRVMLTPTGVPLSQRLVQELSKQEAITWVCGRYEGIDHRVGSFVDLELSIGDYILMGGELPAMVAIEAILRWIPGVLGNADSALTESHGDGLLEYPQYTRPVSFRDMEVPHVLREGNHAAIDAWRVQKSRELTAQRRPDMLKSALVTKDASPKFARARTFVALVHHPTRDREGNAVTTSITNIDIHDIARSCRTFGIEKFFVISPIGLQRELVHRVVEHWTSGEGAQRIPERVPALAHTEAAPSVLDAIERIKLAHPGDLTIIATSAKMVTPQWSDLSSALQDPARSRLILFGTGYGLHPELDPLIDGWLPPILGSSGFNHLSVRAAAAIVLHRFLGEPSG